MYQQLTSSQNQRVKDVCKLRNRRQREKRGLTLLEGYRELSRAFNFNMILRECFFCPSLFLGENEYTLLERLAHSGVAVFEVSETILQKMAYRDRPEGLIATAEIRDHSLDELSVPDDCLLLVAEAIEKPGNLGSMLRSVDAAGADGMIVCNKTTDLYNPNVVRASTGALFSVPLAEAANQDTLQWLRDRGVITVAATPHTETVYTEVDLTRSTAIVVGTEQFGLTEFWLSNADYQVQIPMMGRIDSLNVATATTIILYEAARQRGWQ